MYNTNITNKSQGRTEETQATLDTRHIQHWTQNKGKQNKNTTQKTKKMNNTDPTKKPGVNPGAREGYAVRVSYKTPAVLLIYTVKSGKSIGSDRGNKHLRKK
jgi:hypothetical protein